MVKRLGWFGGVAVALAAAAYGCSSDDDATGANANVDASANANANDASTDAGACIPAAPNEPLDSSVLACDPVGQTCTDPCNAKCAFYGATTGAVSTGQTFAGCGPVLGDAGVGQACVRPADRVGDDTCAKGLECTALGRSSTDPSPLHCRPLCTRNADCAVTEFCASLTDPTAAVAHAGECLTLCDPFADACASDSACSTIADVNDTARLTCAGRTPAPDAGVGSACSVMGADTCPSNAICARGTCETFCDATHPCADGGGACTPAMGTAFSLCQR